MSVDAPNLDFASYVAKYAEARRPKSEKPIKVQMPGSALAIMDIGDFSTPRYDGSGLTRAERIIKCIELASLYEHRLKVIEREKPGHFVGVDDSEQMTRELRGHDLVIRQDALVYQASEEPEARKVGRLVLEYQARSPIASAIRRLQRKYPSYQFDEEALFGRGFDLNWRHIDKRPPGDLDSKWTSRLNSSLYAYGRYLAERARRNSSWMENLPL